MNYTSLSLKQALIDKALSGPNFGNQQTTASLAPIWMRKYDKEQREPNFQDVVVEECDKCDYKHSTSKALYRHKREKHSGLQQHCTDCEYSNHYPNRVKMHYDRVHRGIKRLRVSSHYAVKCRMESCEFVGTKKCLKLQSHKLFYCEQCTSSFERFDYLKFHNEGIHEGLVYSCEYCDKITTKKCDLKRHIFSNHSNGGQNRKQNRNATFCKEEGCSFKTLNGELKRHMETKHDGIVRFKCPAMNCNFRSSAKKEFNRHTKIH